MIIFKNYLFFYSTFFSFEPTLLLVVEFNLRQFTIISPFPRPPPLECVLWLGPSDRMKVHFASVISCPWESTSVYIWPSISVHKNPTKSSRFPVINSSPAFSHRSVSFLSPQAHSFPRKVSHSRKFPFEIGEVNIRLVPSLCIFCLFSATSSTQKLCQVFLRSLHPGLVSWCHACHFLSEKNWC